MAKIYRIIDGSRQPAEAVYVVYDGKLFRTVAHPEGWAEQAEYELGRDGKIYRCADGSVGLQDAPVYEFRGDGRLYRAAGHPQGAVDQAEYELQD